MDRFSKFFLLIFGLCAMFFLPAPAAYAALNTAMIETLSGIKGAYIADEDVYKLTQPLNLPVTVANLPLSPPLGTASWISFKKTGERTLLTGDLVLTESQVNRIIASVLDNGLDVTALHNHFLWDCPRLMFLHISGIGDEKKLAAAAGKVLAEVKATASVKGPAPVINIEGSSHFNTRVIDDILGVSGSLDKGVYRVTFSMMETQYKGFTVGNAMGVSSWAAFTGTDDKAVVDGDFAMREQDLKPVLTALRDTGIYVVAIHNHMVTETPRIVFIHYWGIGSIESLSMSLKTALMARKASGGSDLSTIGGIIDE